MRRLKTTGRWLPRNGKIERGRLVVKRDLFNRVNERTSIATDFPRHLSLSLFLYVFSINISNKLYSSNSLLFFDRRWIMVDGLFLVTENRIAKRIRIEERFVQRDFFEIRILYLNEWTWFNVLTFLLKKILIYLFSFFWNWRVSNSTIWRFD